MSGRLGKLLKSRRGDESRLSFVKKLSLSYTFVRSMEEGLRLPSDEIVEQIASRCEMDVDELILATYCDRSPLLARALRVRGIVEPEEEEEPPPALPSDSARSSG
jgi:hypothetical protein